MLERYSEPAPSLVWLPADHRLLGPRDNTLPYLVLGDKDARSLRDCAQVPPVLFPLANASQISSLIAMVDGVMLTGSPSNVHPSHFNEEVHDSSLPLDPERDSLTLSLVRACVKQGVPLLGICRGFQEINVAMGGSLEQTVHARPGHLDHRARPDLSLADAYDHLSHEVRFVSGSPFETWAGGQTAIVNSLHGQGIGRLAPGLRALAHAPDGLVEAIEIEGATSFAYAVQWHPEWRSVEIPFYGAIMRAFGQACRQHRAQRAGAV